MEGMAEEKRGNIQIRICPTKMTCGKSKKYKEQKLKEIVSKVTAFLNSHYGGTLELVYERIPPQKHVDNCVRAIEQKLCDSIGVLTMFFNVNLSKVMNKAYKNAQPKIILHVLPTDSLATLNYNMYLPTASQVLSVSASEPLEEMRKIIEGVRCNATGAPSETPLMAYQRNFVLNQSAAVEEGVTVQFKSLKSAPSKCITLADRITCNRFPDYVSAFANHLGGHIYYGVDDNGIVEGQDLATAGLKEEITKKVKTNIDKLVWPAHVGVPERGREWDIFFEPVKNSLNGNPVPQTYVVVIAIARCPGGVFTAVPESYFLGENGNVKQMSFSMWRKKLLDGNAVVGDTSRVQEVAPQVEPQAKNEEGATSLSLTHCPTFRSAPVDIPSHVPKFLWSSEKNRKIYNGFTKVLLECRNNHDLERFNKICASASKYPNSDAALVCLSERVAVSYKGHDFSLAESLLEQFSSLCTKETVKDARMFYVRELYLRSRIERAKGCYEESSCLALVGLQQLQCIQAEFIATWFYMHAAIVTTMLPGEGDVSRYDEARQYLNLAKASLTQLKYFPDQSDLEQKLCIYMAEILLGFSFSGNALDSRHITIEAIDEAEHELNKGLTSNGGRLTHFRESQYRLVLSDLARRKAEFCHNQQERLGNLEHASEFAKKAFELASEHQFKELILYSNARLIALSEKVERLRNTIRVTDDSEVLKDLENFIEC